jgi:hypothetical protein
MGLDPIRHEASGKKPSSGAENDHRADLQRVESVRE